jgi:hypothetical protein
MAEVSAVIGYECSAERCGNYGELRRQRAERQRTTRFFPTLACTYLLLTARENKHLLASFPAFLV